MSKAHNARIASQESTKPGCLGVTCAKKNGFSVIQTFLVVHINSHISVQKHKKNTEILSGEATTLKKFTKLPILNIFLKQATILPIFIQEDQQTCSVAFLQGCCRCQPSKQQHSQLHKWPYPTETDDQNGNDPSTCWEVVFFVSVLMRYQGTQHIVDMKKSKKTYEFKPLQNPAMKGRTVGFSAGQTNVN